ncbi:transmembrane protein, putative [Medicago truncatula]|uniref:Transmembrane protein, putative n=1 Tax=Medicago truncatula TaxID=3880 RepID=G7K4F7_MEDTR|nr:transmembrane protein, putative [Medicago truncatula]
MDDDSLVLSFFVIFNLMETICYSSSLSLRSGNQRSNRRRYGFCHWTIFVFFIPSSEVLLLVDVLIFV